ncbi:ATP-binding cassette domain-containing protein [Massilia sp. NR 4-1]|uniref:ABC transporter ATP-binding protein n=1 Tax=Massilia sp. NR 4-1 TaxID=1678028 RepID=UPI00067D120F|nr:ATP-binding cassette domain-containing protein [Massilia sp. NR 4-1]AKU23409.1 ABC transporter ATP-binding protein [Massilia sp. NR 4-1]
MEMNTVLEISSLNYEFSTRVLFRNLSLKLGAGITWLRGENGAGKTTLLKLAAGAMAPHGGSIRLHQDGQSAALDCAATPLAYRRQSHFCGGDTPQLPWLTVREMLDLHLALYPAADAELLNQQLQALRLQSTLEQPITTLSLGQHKKMQLALALTLPVRLLLIDEPFNGLDAEAVAYLQTQLADPARLGRQCIILTSHVEPAIPLSRTLHL